MSANSYIDQMKALSIDDEKKNMREKYKPDMQADIDADGAVWDSQINSTQNYYDKQIGDTKTAYDSEYQKNAVQKLINEKKIAETNANLGLTDSGLNRTQQTAAQLSYANQKGKIDLARQSALDNLTLAMTDAITTLQNQKVASARDITKQWNDYADTQAQNIYNTKYNGYVDMHNAQVEADAAVQKAAIEASAKAPNVSYGAGGTYDNNYILRTKDGLLSRGYYGTLKDNGVDTVYNYDDDGEILSVTYTDNNSEKQTTIAYGKNPYTGEDNINGNSDAAKAVKKYGAYDNGYQPKGVYLNGKDYGKMIEVVGKTDPKTTDGIAFNIFKTMDIANGTHYWVWDAAINNYAEIIKTGGEWKFEEE